MASRRSSCAIRLENFENAEALIENYRRELEIGRLHEALESMLDEEDESISTILNGAYGDYLLISTELLPLIDSFLPSIKQFQEKVDGSLGRVTSLVEAYSEDFEQRVSDHGHFFVKKLELNLFRACRDEVSRYRETLLAARGRFSGDEARTALSSVRLVHLCILRLLRLRESICGVRETVSRLDAGLGLELGRSRRYGDCFEICSRFSEELREMVVRASDRLLLDGARGGRQSLEDLAQSDHHLLLRCIFLLGVGDEFVETIRQHVGREAAEACRPSAPRDERLLFSEAVRGLEKVLGGERLAGFTKKLVSSMFAFGHSEEYLRFAIDVYVRGVLLFLLERVEEEYSDHIVSPTAPMDLFIHQLDSVASFIERSERILVDCEFDGLSADRRRELSLRILVCFRGNRLLNSYSKKCKFGTYWNLVYRNILNRRISIRNEPVEFSKVYVYDGKKYWLKYTVEIIRQIRWIVGNSSIHSSAPLPPSRYLAPLFTRCLYSSLSLLYDHSSYLLSFAEGGRLPEAGSDSNRHSIWSPKTKPEHVCCLLMDAVSFREWVRLHFVDEVFFHIDKVRREFGLGEQFDHLSGSEALLDVDRLRLVVEEDLLRQGYLAHVDESLLRPLASATSLHLASQTTRIFESGLRAVPCLYRLTASSSTLDRMQGSDRMPSSYVESATKPVEVFLVFSLNAINSIVSDLSADAIREITQTYRGILADAFEQVFGTLFDLCEKQILSSRHQLASLQKLAQKSIEGSVANMIDPNVLASQYTTDIDAWLTKVLRLVESFFGSLGGRDGDQEEESKKQVSEYIRAVKEAPNSVNLRGLLDTKT